MKRNNLFYLIFLLVVFVFPNNVGAEGESYYGYNISTCQTVTDPSGSNTICYPTNYMSAYSSGGSFCANFPGSMVGHPPNLSCYFIDTCNVYGAQTESNTCDGSESYFAPSNAYVNRNKSCFWQSGTHFSFLTTAVTASMPATCCAEGFPIAQGVCPHADLVASTVTPTSAIVGTAVNFRGTVTNSGVNNTATGFSNLFQVATAANGGGTVSNISVNALSTSLKINLPTIINSSSYTFSTAGTRSVRLCADMNASSVGTITESNESNNCGTWTNVSVTAVPVNATANIDASPTTIPSGSASTLSWSYSNASACTITSQPNPTIYPSGSGSASTGNLVNDRTYTITCDPGAVDSVIVNVQAASANYTLNVIKSGQGIVTSVSNPTQTNINCGASCQSTYSQNTIVTLTATPNTGRIFTGWGGACSGIGSCNLTMDNSKTVTANFAVDPNYREF
jgi:hypothetical protein